MLVLSKTIAPTPAPVDSPAITAPSDILPPIYNLVKSTLAAQFGIRPIMLVTSGWNIEPDNIIFSKSSMPIASTINPKINEITNRKANIFKVCLTLALKIPSCSQSQSLHVSCICSCISSECSCAVCLFLNIKSIIVPNITAIINFIPSIKNNSPFLSGEDRSIGIASSLVDKNTAIKVPIVITLLENRLAATALKPH